MMTRDPLETRLQNWFVRRRGNAGTWHSTNGLVSCGTDVGIIRSDNQDRVAVLNVQTNQWPSFMVAVVCDGMGGMVDGGQCASIAMGAFLAACIKYRDEPLQTRLIRAARLANDRVFDEFRGRGGTTLSSVAVEQGGYSLGVNVGDSRIYAWANKELLQLSVDDTLAGQVRRYAGGEEGLRSHELLQYVGVGPSIEPHLICPLPQSSELMLVLTSDGIHFLRQDTLSAIVSNSRRPSEIVNRLINVAKWHGGHDNASVVAIDHPEQLFSNEEKTPSSTIRVSDPFGELEIIGVERSAISLNPTSAIQEYISNPTDVQPEDQAIKTIPYRLAESQIPKSSRQKKKPKTQKRRGAASTKSNNKKERGKPQLKIEFEK